MALNENALKWVEALESGKYLQGRRQLSRPDGTEHCCLGVACQLAIEAGLPLRFAHNGWYHSTDGSEKMWMNYLPPMVQEWLGLASTSGDYLDDKGEKCCLAWRNDSGDTFEQIAEVIKSEPEGLFQ